VTNHQSSAVDTRLIGAYSLSLPYCVCGYIKKGTYSIIKKTATYFFIKYAMDEFYTTILLLNNAVS